MWTSFHLASKLSEEPSALSLFTLQGDFREGLQTISQEKEIETPR